MVQAYSPPAVKQLRGSRREGVWHMKHPSGSCGHPRPSAAFKAPCTTNVALCRLEATRAVMEPPRNGIKITVFIQDYEAIIFSIRDSTTKGPSSAGRVQFFISLFTRYISLSIQEDSHLSIRRVIRDGEVRTTKHAAHRVTVLSRSDTRFSVIMNNEWT